MGCGLKRLSAIAVRSAAAGKHADKGGLWLHKRRDGVARWLFRFTARGRRREMVIWSGIDGQIGGFSKLGLVCVTPPC